MDLVREHRRLRAGQQTTGIQKNVFKGKEESVLYPEWRNVINTLEEVFGGGGGGMKMCTWNLKVDERDTNL